MFPQHLPDAGPASAPVGAVGDEVRPGPPVGDHAHLGVAVAHGVEGGEAPVQGGGPQGPRALGAGGGGLGGLERLLLLLLLAGILAVDGLADLKENESAEIK